MVIWLICGLGWLILWVLGILGTGIMEYRKGISLNVELREGARGFLFLTTNHPLPLLSITVLCSGALVV